MISIICPVYNEQEYIGQLIDFYEGAEPQDKELILIDGNSSDSTVKIIKERQERNASVKLLYNHDKYVPYALNKGIRSAKGDILIRVDAHTKYAPDYFTKIIETFGEVEADIVGGPTRTAWKEPFQSAVAQAICTSFGVGNSLVHDIGYRGYADSVTFGAWRKELFKEIGYFDERLHRNQDDEFHYRARSKGKKVYLNPDIKLWYYPRKTVKSLFRQYYQYGLFKPMVLKKIKSETKLRHLIPSFFFLYFLSLLLAIWFPWWLIPLGLYLLLDITYALRSTGGIMVKLYTLIVYPAIHIAYGSGFLAGLSKK